MALDNLQAVSEHQLVRTFMPLVMAGLIAGVTFLFTTLGEIENLALENKLQLEHLHDAEEDFGKQMEKVEETLTDLRVQVGRFMAH
tara:strand:- start:134 stop:391 length:258 start_codon:yes stop_codon:yes gene_type:complete